MVYQPMVELLRYLRANGFKAFIVSGGGIEFMRPWAEKSYGIPPEQVVGSSGKLYLAAVLDLFSRFIVGWAVSAVNDRHVTIKALEMALKRRCPDIGLLHHSDQGCTYASEDYQRILDAIIARKHVSLDSVDCLGAGLEILDLLEGEIEDINLVKRKANK
jgi:transposase InsO family protein